ncbi:MAG: type II toxin-antitoxin system RelE/ParE family toxin [Pirellulaceae bacterium]
MTFRVVILPRAEADIEANARWWASSHSPEQAAQWFDAVHEQLKSLSDSPEINGFSAENDAFPYKIRDKLLGLGSRRSYRAVFTIKGEAVYVLTVRRASQDVLRPDQVDAPTSA